MPIERVVVILTPLFAALAGLITSSVGQLAPGVNLNPADVTALFIAGASAALAVAVKWLHGRQAFVKVEQDVDHFADLVVQKVRANQVAAPALREIESVVKAHTDQIVVAVGNAVHAPPSVEQVVEAMAKKLAVAPAPVAPPPSPPAV